MYKMNKATIKKTAIIFSILILISLVLIFFSGGLKLETPPEDITFLDTVDQLMLALWVILKAAAFILITLVLIVGALFCFILSVLGYLVDILISGIVSLSVMSLTFMAPVSEAFYTAAIYLIQMIPKLSAAFFGA